MFGFASQWAYAKRERRSDVKKIQALVRREYAELYLVLMNEKQKIKSTRLRYDEDFNSLIEHRMSILSYLKKIGGLYLALLLKNVVISSGNLIKLNDEEIEIIQSVQQRAEYYNKRIRLLNNNIDLVRGIELDKKLANNAFNRSDMCIFKKYLDDREQIVDETVEHFNILNKLPWFDYDKIKNTAATHTKAQNQTRLS